MCKQHKRGNFVMELIHNRQQIRSKERKLQKIKQTILRLQETGTKQTILNAMLAAIDPYKSPTRKGLEAAAMFSVMSRGNLEHGFYYFKIISSLPDIVLANDCSNFVFNRAVQYSIEDAVSDQF